MDNNRTGCLPVLLAIMLTPVSELTRVSLVSEDEKANTAWSITPTLRRRRDLCQGTRRCFTGFGYQRLGLREGQLSRAEHHTVSPSQIRNREVDPHEGTRSPYHRHLAFPP